MLLDTCHVQVLHCMILLRLTAASALVIIILLSEVKENTQGHTEKLLSASFRKDLKGIH